jgi:P-type Ca2+ transporter type 2C
MKYSYTGLSASEVKESRNAYGSNELSMTRGETFWHKLIANFKDPLIIILLVALIVIVVLSFLGLTEWYEAVGIGAAVLLSVFVSTFSEFKNENSFQKLQEEASLIYCNVFRDGEINKVFINDIVKGDYVLLQSGDKLPADGRLVQGELRVNQASLTGESYAVLKKSREQSYIPDSVDFSDPYFVYRGSVVEDGEAVMIVEAVGAESFYGKLTDELSVKSSRLSPLQIKLKNLAKLISRFGYIGAVLIFLAFVFNKIVIAHDFNPDLILEYIKNWELFVNDVVHALVLSIIIIVAAVPEGLPMMIAIVLSLNMRKMLSEKVLVRKLLGIETSGSINILFTDKTGTITKGKLEPVFMINGEGESFDKYEKIPESLRELFKIAVSENSFSVIDTQGNPVGGNASERALISFIDINDRLQDNEDTTTLATIRFNSAKKFSATLVEGGANFEKLFLSNKVSFIKGAVEVLMEKCTSYFDKDGKLCKIESKRSLIEKSDNFANQGIRLIAIACSDNIIQEAGDLPEGLALLGIIGIKDDIRPESKKAIEMAHNAGIQVVMITGDRKGTAAAIAGEVGLLKSDKDIVITSQDLNNMSDEEIAKILPDLKVVARALPTDKSRLVRIAQNLGKVVGMTGDGVNDSSALKLSDVGFAMGSGSEVAKEAGDIVILDDNFSSITNAIRYGRTIFKSIRKFIIFQLTVNIAAVLTAFIGPLVGFDFPLTIIQLLWINIIMDTLAAMALGGEPALKRFMKEMPIDRKANIISKYMTSGIFTGGLYITAFSLFFLLFPPFKEFFMRNGAPDNDVFLTAFFNLFIFLVMFNSFNARTNKINLFEKILSNKGFLPIIALIFFLQVVFTYIGGDVLRTTSLNLKEWGLILVMSISIIPVDLLRKIILKFFLKVED